jgi:DNA polymerase-3 subunit beta
VEALAAAGRAVSTRASLPVLSGVRLELSGDQLRVTGSDLDTTISATVKVAGAGDGQAVINAKLVTDIVRALPEGSVELAVENDEATITAGRSQFSVRTIPASEFPNLVEPSGDAVTVDGAHFAAAVRQVVSAASNDENRPILRGVQMEAEDGGVKLVATDSYRLAVRDLPGTTLLEEGGSVLVPRQALQELLRMLSGSEEALTVRLGERDAAFEVGGSYLITRLIDGQFPNYRNLIPESQPNKMTVGREALIEAAKRVRVVARDASTPVRLTMKPGSLELSASTQDYGTAFEQLDVDYQGEELTVAFNPEYLVAGLEAATGDEVTLESVDALRPALLRSTDDADYRYVLMPVRI